MSRSYLTTAIPYVNAAPHLGFALELVQADTLARHRRLRGDEVRLTSGTDDNAGKNVLSARAAGVAVADFVASNGDRFADLARPLQVELDDFVRTSVDPRHLAIVEKLWRASADRGDFYQRSYTGLYCVGCEQFYAAGELAEGRCPEHLAPVESVTETNWFFRLSSYQDRIVELIESDTLRIEPPQRRNEVLAFLRGGLADISVSRPAARSGGWGIPVPGDPDQVIYVWWDALANYLSDLDFWESSAERVHIIGKGIVRFHAVYWPALLLSGGVSLPTRILVHDYLTVSGNKISKSGPGTGGDPTALISQYGSDALRWWLLADVARIGDTDFSTERLVDRANADLANGLGNLFHRVVGLRPPQASPGRLAECCAGLPQRIDDALRVGDFRSAAFALREVVEAANRFVAAEQPWLLRDQPERRAEVLADLAFTCALLARELAPFLPEGAARLSALLSGEWTEGPVFPRIS